MLIEFRVENHRSIRDEQVLTFVAGRGGDADDPRARSVEGSPDPLLPVIGIFGANASGKSNVLSAWRFMGTAVHASLREWDPDKGVPREPFAWGESRKTPSLYEATLLVDGVRYEYGFVADDHRFLEEWLYAFPHGRKQTWFERDEEGIRIGDHLHGETKAAREITRANALFLSAAAQLNQAQMLPLYSWFSRTTGRGRRKKGERPSSETDDAALAAFLKARIFDDGLSEAFTSLVKRADLGIVAVKAVANAGVGGAREPEILFQHQAGADSWLPLNEESGGTWTLVEMAPRVLQTIEHGSLFFVDELEKKMHPHLAAQIVDLFNSPKTNPKGAQLLFTTHDTNLLGSEALRRDQVWFTEKAKDGASKLYPLTDFHPRKAENLERGYLQGRYGAVPYIGSLIDPRD